MPDTKLTWANLRENLRKYAVIYIVAVALTLVLTNLIWTSTAPRVPAEEQVLIYMANNYSNPDPLDGIAAEILERTQAEDPTLREVEFQSLLYTGAEDYTSVMLMMTRLAVGEGDAFLCSESAMGTLVGSGAALALDDYYAGGWLADSGLEPYYATVEDEEAGTSETFLAGFRIDGLTALSDMGAFDNAGAYLAVASNGTNTDTTLRAVAHMVEALERESGHD